MRSTDFRAGPRGLQRGVRQRPFARSRVVNPLYSAGLEVNVTHFGAACFLSYAALRGIPFTLCSLLFCRRIARERARVAHRHPPGDPGSRRRKSPLARSTQRIPSGLSGTGGCNLPVKPPSPRIPARRPGLTEMLRRFSAGPGCCCNPFIPMQ